MTAKGAQKRKDLARYLKEAEDYVNKAIQLTNEDYYKHHLANHHLLLGYIHSELLQIKKSTEEQVIAYYEKARRYNPAIKIKQVSIPPEYQPQFRPLGSPESSTQFMWTIND